MWLFLKIASLTLFANQSLGSSVRLSKAMECSLKNLDLVDDTRTFKMPTYSFILGSAFCSRTAIFPCFHKWENRDSEASILTEVHSPGTGSAYAFNTCVFCLVQYIRPFLIAPPWLCPMKGWGLVFVNNVTSGWRLGYWVRLVSVFLQPINKDSLFPLHQKYNGIDSELCPWYLHLTMLESSSPRDGVTFPIQPGSWEDGWSWTTGVGSVGF